MLTDLSWLAPGQQFPPECEVRRLRNYEENRQLFENEHAEVYSEAFRRIERVIGNFEDVVSYPVIVNFQKKLSLKTADFLWIEPPRIVAGEGSDPDSAEQQAINAIIEGSDLFNTGYENAIDISRYGDGLLLVYKEGDKGIIDVGQPGTWFCVVDRGNIKRILYHVLCTTWTEGVGSNKKYYMRSQVHERGRYTEANWAMRGATDVSGTMIIDSLIDQRVIPTGLSDFALVHVPNIITSDRVYGIDDYVDVDSIITELLVRIAQISRVLDKHAAPSVEGPMSALEKDPATGQWRLKMGSYFAKTSKDDAETKYIVWDAQMDASFKQIEKLINFLGVVSEMGPALFDSAEKSGEVASGTALRLRYIQPLSKVRRLTMRLTPALVKAIKLCSELGGTKLTDAKISVTWQDGLPENDKDRAEIAQMRTGGKATMSIRDAIQYLDGKTPKQADAAYEAIIEEEADAAPVAIGAENPDDGQNT